MLADSEIQTLDIFWEALLDDELTKDIFRTWSGLPWPFSHVPTVDTSDMASSALFAKYNAMFREEIFT